MGPWPAEPIECMHSPNLSLAHCRAEKPLNRHQNTNIHRSASSADIYRHESGYSNRKHRTSQCHRIGSCYHYYHTLIPNRTPAKCMHFIWTILFINLIRKYFSIACLFSLFSSFFLFISLFPWL